MHFIRKLFILVVLLSLCLVGIVPISAQTGAGVVISQVYGGGGNTGTTLRNDFIELFNAGTTPVNLNGWSVQYASATGTTWTNRTNLSAVILAPGQYYLIQESAGGGGTQNLPAPDVTGTILMSASAGKVALVNSQTNLSCAANCASASGVIDFIGYGSTNDAEGTSAPVLTATTADLRNGGGCTDTNNNSADFTAGAPNPRNTASPFNDCSGATPTPSNTPAITLTPSITFTPSSTPSTSARIREIQGSSHISPKQNQTVTSVPGIVTSLYYITTNNVTSARGFYMQDPSPDSDDSTSEGILIFTNSAPTVAIGDSVLVSGSVSEFRPGGSGGTGNLTITEITGPIVTKLSSGNALPAPVIIGVGGRVPPTMVIDDDATGDVETSGTFDAATDGIDFYESMEGMLVQLNNAIVVGPTNAFGETVVLPDGGVGASVRTPRGGILVRPNDFNPERITIDDEILKGLQIALPSMSVTDIVTGAAVGVMDYTFGDFMIELTGAISPTSGGLTPEVTSLAASDRLRIATFNVENLTPQDSPSKYAALGSQVVNNLLSPDIIVIEEVQDNNGATDNGVVDATNTWNALINAIATAGGPTYQYRQIDPVNDQDGGEPGGNIRQGFLFNPARVVFVDRAGGNSTTPNAVTCVAGEAQLQFSPGRLDPANSAWSSSRKPLAGEFTFNGQRVIVIGNHFNSKGGDTPLFGHVQPPVLSSATQRTAQATVVHDFVDQALTCESNANVVVLGDLNDFEFSTPIQTLKGTILDNLVETLSATERYSYVFAGNSQVLDQILVTHHLTASASPQYDVVHINAEFFHDTLPGSVRTSDHDPSIVALSLPVASSTSTPTNTAAAPSDTPSFTPTNTAAAPSDTPSFTPTNTAVAPSDTPSFTPTNTAAAPSDTPSFTPTNMVAAPSDTPSFTPTNTVAAPSDTPSFTPTNTVAAPSDTPSFTPTNTVAAPSDTPSFTPTNTAAAPSDTPSFTPTDTVIAPSATPSRTPTDTATVGITNTFTNTPTDTLTPSVTNTFTRTPTDTPQPPTNTFTRTPTDTLTPSVTNTFTHTPTDTPQPPTNTFTRTPTNTAVPPSATPSRTPTNTAIVPSDTPSRTPTNTAVPPSATPSRTPTNTAIVPSDTPSRTPTNTAVPASLTPSNTSSPAMTFYRAINLGGPALVIDGHNWEANTSTTPNFTTTGSAMCNPYQPLTPSTDANRTSMIQCYREHWAFNTQMTNLPAGTYVVYVYVWQNWNDPANNVFSLTLEGQTVVSNFNPGHVAGVWSKLGPFTVNVTDGTLNLTTSGGGLADLSGLEVYSLSSGGLSSATPTATRTNAPAISATPTRTVTPSNTPVATTVTPTRTITRTNTPSAPLGFYRAYNLGGPSLVIDGHTWLAGNSSEVSIDGATAFCNQTVPLNPATDATRTQMIRCAVRGTSPNATIDGVTNGAYHLYLYIWEDNTPSTYSLSIQGGQVYVPSINSGAAGSWQRMGPYTINVTGGWVSIDSFGGQANFSGIELYRR